MQYDVWKASSSFGKFIQIVNTGTSRMGLLEKKKIILFMTLERKRSNQKYLFFFSFTEKFSQSKAKQSIMDRLKGLGPTLLFLLT